MRRLGENIRGQPERERTHKAPFPVAVGESGDQIEHPRRQEVAQQQAEIQPEEHPECFSEQPLKIDRKLFRGRIIIPVRPVRCAQLGNTFPKHGYDVAVRDGFHPTEGSEHIRGGGGGIGGGKVPRLGIPPRVRRTPRQNHAGQQGEKIPPVVAAQNAVRLGRLPEIGLAIHSLSLPFLSESQGKFTSNARSEILRGTGWRHEAEQSAGQAPEEIVRHADQGERNHDFRHPCR